MEKPGYYLDKHYTAYLPDIIHMAKEGRVLDLENLLWPLMEAMEAECAAEALPRPRTFHDVFLMVLRYQHAPRRDEMALLQDYLRYPILTDDDRTWAENELELVRGKLVA